jgi:hypothetical protein
VTIPFVFFSSKADTKEITLLAALPVVAVTSAENPLQKGIFNSGYGFTYLPVQARPNTGQVQPDRLRPDEGYFLVPLRSGKSFCLFCADVILTEPVF